ncbi:hypothetical protein [Micromonospora sp. DT47]|uniref:hypothetical protein n=1 Tax=Micromonospora sp. DT47 TaxID=3393431 RepID=UPI003CE96D58
MRVPLWGSVGWSYARAQFPPGDRARRLGPSGDHDGPAGVMPVNELSYPRWPQPYDHEGPCGEVPTAPEQRPAPRPSPGP